MDKASTATPEPVELLRIALEIARPAARLALSMRADGAEVVSTKSSATDVVTAADRAVERSVVMALRERRPGDAVLGEESGEARGGASASGAASGAASDAPVASGSVRWILDPIDGTKHYVRGIPLWATLIALEREGAVVLGVASAPALGVRWWADRGGGAFANGEPIRVSSVAGLDEAAFSHAGAHSFDKRGHGEGLRALSERAWMERAYGDFWQHMLVAEGRLDFAIEAVVNLWDLAAIQPIVEEAGGRFTDFGGVARPDGGNSLSSNGLLHDEVLAAFGSR
jgi:histidinol-phosphatase